MQNDCEYQELEDFDYADGVEDHNYVVTGCEENDIDTYN